MGEAKMRRLAAVRIGDSTDAKASDSAVDTWPLANDQALEQVKLTLSNHDVDFSRPGFHDSVSFMSAERADGTFIDNVARIVEAKSYSIEELNAAAAKIEIAAEAVRAAVEADGRPGLCVTASGVLSRILDAMGVWNYCAKATLTISFPAHVSKSARYFYAIDEGQFSAPHSIVVAPPFTVIDLTVKHQAFDLPQMAAALPGMIMSRSFSPYTWSCEDIVAPNLRATRMKSRNDVEAYLRIRNPQMLKTMDVLPGRQVSTGGGSVLRYVMTGVGGYVERLEDLDDNARINGRRPIDIFKEDVLPRLRTAR